MKFNLVQKGHNRTKSDCWVACSAYKITVDEKYAGYVNTQILYTTLMPDRNRLNTATGKGIQHGFTRWQLK
jgi:hypothetical protein